MKKSTTIRMSMFCPEVPPTPFGMMDRNVTRRRPKANKKATEPSKLSLRRPDRPAEPPSDQENAPPTPRRQGRRLYSRPEIAEIGQAADLPPPAALPRPRPPLRPTAGRQAETAEVREPRPCPGAAAGRGQETDALLQKMTEMSLAEDPAAGGQKAASSGGNKEALAVPTEEERGTRERWGEQLSPESRMDAVESPGHQFTVEESPRKSLSVGRLDPPPELPSPARNEPVATAARSPATAAEPRRPLSSDSFASAASSPVVGRPASARTPAPVKTTAIAQATSTAAQPTAAAPAGRRDSDSDSDSDSERSLPYFTPRRTARRRPAAAVLESSGSDGGGGGGPVPLLTRALRRLPATTSTPAPGVAAGWRLEATELPSPVLEAEPTPAPAPVPACPTDYTQQQAERIPPAVGGTAALGGIGKRQAAPGHSERLAADSPLILRELGGPAPATPRTLAGETSDSSSSVEMVEPGRQRKKPSPARKHSPPPARERSPLPVLTARAPLRAPGRAAASPLARPPPLPAGAVPGVDVARWLEESPLMTAVSEESDVVVIDSDQEWDDSDLLSVSERAAAAQVAADDGLELLPPASSQPQQDRGRPRPEMAPQTSSQPQQDRGRPRPEMAPQTSSQPQLDRGRPRPEMAPQPSPPRHTRRQSAGSSSSEDGLERFKRQFVTPRQKQRVPSSSSSDAGDFIDDGPVGSGSDESDYRRAVAADAVPRRTPRVDPDIRASDESPEAAEVSPGEPPFRPPPTRQTKRPVGTARVAPSPHTGRPLSFMSSLASHLVEGRRRNPEAAGFVTSFRSRRLQLARRLFDMVNSEVFDRQLPADLEIKFNKRMLRTAGYCYSRQAAASGADPGLRSARVELSEKVVDSAERLRDTLVHELCHAAAWVVSGYRGGHGPVWRSWAARVQRRYPELPPVTRCHSYQIHCKFTYRCTSCGYSFGRHSKSLDVTRKVCGKCRGVFECLLTAKMDGKDGAAAPATPRAAAPFALFVKEHYSAVKSATAGLKHAEVMRLLGQKFAETKISRAKAKATECEDF